MIILLSSLSSFIYKKAFLYKMSVHTYVVNKLSDITYSL